MFSEAIRGKGCFLIYVYSSTLALVHGVLRHGALSLRGFLAEAVERGTGSLRKPAPWVMGFSCIFFPIVLGSLKGSF
jgi:hypothetical protein